MSNVTHQNPNFHLNKPPHKLNTKNDVSLKTKPTRKSTRSNKNKTNNNYTKNTNKPLKVVHISNPIKYEASPTEFRALVQGLTGRDAVVEWPDYDHHHHHHRHRVNHQETVAVGGDGSGDGSSDGGITDDQLVHQVYQGGNNNHDEDFCGDVTSFSGCFGPSDHINSYDYFVPLYHGDIHEDFRALMEDH